MFSVLAKDQRYVQGMRYPFGIYQSVQYFTILNYDLVVVGN
tara:strand:+ start:1024 stop:1146 length:123 start_codon:yes stop_codon:yes gene_type:complete